MSAGSAPPRVSARSLEEARALLSRVWRHADFRYHQRRAVLAALRGRDALVVLPTSGGKSLCYQVPALLLPGFTVVVSPLISLMQDQVAALRARGVPAAYLSSTQSPDVRRSVWEALLGGGLRLLYVAPERMGELVQRVRRGMVALVAIDEAHCISEWGHDFRPKYRSLGRHRQALGVPPVMAVTATATRATRRDIIAVLRLHRPVRVEQSFDRPNLFFGVRHVVGEGQQVLRLAHLLRETPGTAIVYVMTRNRTDGAAALLRRWGFDASPYHAGLPAGDRRRLLQRFLAGKLRVMVATNAFGMGIDKPDIRLVAHLGVPTRPEAYFQEAGRAGRDGTPARCELLWTDGDLGRASRMARAQDREHGGAAAHRAARKQALETMRRYVQSRGCRRRLLLAYLGERLRSCAGCDRCGEHSERGVSRLDDVMS